MSTLPFELTVPAEPAHLATVRLFVASVARSVGADDEVVDDLRLAVSELATAIATRPGSDVVHVSATAEADTLIVEVGPVMPDDRVDGAIDPVDIVLGLFPGTVRHPGDATVRLPVPLPAP